MPISKLHSALAVADLLAHNNMTISYYGQVNTFGGTIYFACDGSYIQMLRKNYRKYASLGNPTMRERRDPLQKFLSHENYVPSTGQASNHRHIGAYGPKSSKWTVRSYCSPCMTGLLLQVIPVAVHFKS